MSKTDDLVKALEKPKKSKKAKNSTPWYKRAALVVWESRPINWLGIGLAYVCVAYTTFRFASYWVNYPELTGIAAFVATLAIGSRAFKKKV